MSAVLFTGTPTRRADSSSDPTARSRRPSRVLRSPSSRPRAQTTNTMKATGTGPTFVEIASVTEEAMYPSGAERSVKARPPSPMYVTSVAATGVNFAKRISEPFRRPTPTAPGA